MKSLRMLLGATLLVALSASWGCESTDPAPDEAQPKQAEPAPEGGGSYAGVWKRPDSGAVFQVKDAGGVVRGKLQPGTWLWVEEGYEPEELFESFEFELERSGEGLKGSATFRFPDSDRSYTSAWKVRLEGGELKAKVEELELTDSGEVASRAEVERVFGFEPEIPPAPPTVVRGASDGAFQGDLSALVRAPGRISLGEGVEVGYRIEVETEAAGHARRHFLAVVGESGDRWRLETNEGLEAYGAGGSILGLVVTKEGVVESAVLGKAGEAGVAVQLLAAGESPPPREEEVEVEVRAGTYPATLSTLEVGGQAYKSWIGREGRVEGVLLKFEGPGGSSKELEAEPELESAELGETLELRSCTYTNGDALSYSSDAVVQALAGGLVRYEAAGVRRALTRVGSKAEPQLRWE